MFSSVALLAGAICLGGDEKQQIKPGATASIKASEQRLPSEPVTVERTADEEAIHQADNAFVTAYEQGDAPTIASLFTVDAEYVDESGNVFQGRKAIEESLKEFFAENPDCRLEMNIDSMRFISPGVVIEDGHTTVSGAESTASIDSRYTTVYVRSEGKWLAASVRNHAPKGRREHCTQLQQLQWLLGDWVDEGDDAVVKFSCEAADRGNFLLRSFRILIAGQEAMSGTQRIGWDPVTGKLRAWCFDSEGGFCDGQWHHDSEDNSWTLKTVGVTADGQTASSTSIYTLVDEHTMTWQSVDHEIAGVRQPDSEVFTIVRKPPAPLTATVSEDQAATATGPN